MSEYYDLANQSLFHNYESDTDLYMTTTGPTWLRACLIDRIFSLTRSLSLLTSY